MPWAAYTRFLSSHPLMTRCITAGVILSGADYTCQKLESHPVSWRRVASMGLTGAVFVAPCVYGWYGFLGRMFGEGSSFRVVSRKLVLDQLLFAPFMFGSIMTSANLLNGKSWAQASEKLREEFKGVLLRGWCVWPITNAFNFAVIPPQYRVLFNNAISFCWNTFLSLVNNRPLHHDPSAPATSTSSNPKMDSTGTSPAPAAAVPAQHDTPATASSLATSSVAVDSLSLAPAAGTVRTTVDVR